MTNKNIIEYIRKNKNLCKEYEGLYSLIYGFVLRFYTDYGVTPYEARGLLLKNRLLQKEAKDIVQQLFKKISEVQ